MSRYWDFSLPSAEVHPTTISKVRIHFDLVILNVTNSKQFNTLLQLVLIGTTTIEPILAIDIATYLSIMQYTVATTTIWSGLSYVYSKDAVKILRSGEQKKGQV
jgi:cardiolipin synthase (CMP-forming)